MFDNRGLGSGNDRTDTKARDHFFKMSVPFTLTIIINTLNCHIYYIIGQNITLGMLMNNTYFGSTELFKLPNTGEPAFYGLE